MTIRHDPPTLEEAVHIAFGNREFMENWRRLRGSTLGLDKRTPIERMIDATSGFSAGDLGGSERELHEFFEFVRDYVWWPALMNWIQENGKEVSQ